MIDAMSESRDWRTGGRSPQAVRPLGSGRTSPEEGPTSARLRMPRLGRGLILEILPTEDAWFSISDETGLFPTRRYRLNAGAALRLRLPVRPDGGYALTVSRLGGSFSRRFAGRLPAAFRSEASADRQGHGRSGADIFPQVAGARAEGVPIGVAVEQIADLDRGEAV